MLNLPLTVNLCGLHHAGGIGLRLDSGDAPSFALVKVIIFIHRPYFVSHVGSSCEVILQENRSSVLLRIGDV